MTKGIGVFRDQSSMEGAKAAIDDVSDRVPKMSVQNKGKVFNTDLIFTLEWSSWPMSQRRLSTPR